MNFPGSSPVPKSSRSFWNKPEGTTGMVSLALLGAGGFFLFQAIAPAILSALGTAVAIVGQTIVLVALCVVLAAFLYVVFNQKFQTLVKYLFKSVMRNITGVFIEIDPIGIMKSYIESMMEKKTSFVDKKTALRGQIGVFEQTIDNNAKEAAKSMNMVEAAKRSKQPKEVTFYSREYGRLTDANKGFGITLTKMQMLYQFMQKYDEACDFVIRDLKSEVKIREQERRMSIEGHSAMKAAMSILKGSGAEKELFDETMEFVIDDYAQKMGEIDDFMSSTDAILNGINLQNGMWEAEAEKQLRAFESRSDSLLLGGTKRLVLENASTSLAPDAGRIDGPGAPPRGADDYMSKFLDKK